MLHHYRVQSRWVVMIMAASASPWTALLRLLLQSVCISPARWEAITGSYVHWHQAELVHCYSHLPKVWALIKSACCLEVKARHLRVFHQGGSLSLCKSNRACCDQFLSC